MSFNKNQFRDCTQEINYSDEQFSLFIRPLKKEDAEIIHLAIMLSLDNLRPFMDWAHRSLSVEGQQERIKISNENFSKGISYDFAVFDKKTGEFLMSASLNPPRVPNKKCLGIGYWTSSKSCNKGLATLATKILIAIAFENLDCDRVEISCNRANQKSLRVIEKCGFKLECEARNYFPMPTDEMIRQGHNLERSAMLYALIKEDVLHLDWYDTVCKHISVN